MKLASEIVGSAKLRKHEHEIEIHKDVTTTPNNRLCFKNENYTRTPLITELEVRRR